MFKKFLRTLASYKAQMISMVIMCAISLGVFIGFSGGMYLSPGPAPIMFCT